MFRSRFFAARTTNSRYFRMDDIISSVLAGIRRLVFFG